MSERRFSDLDLNEPLMRAIADMGYVHPTPVQSAAIPLVATGRDLMVQSQTGTGKTAAFGIPVLDRIVGEAAFRGSAPGGGVRILGLCPTRELARQVADEFDALNKYSKLQTVAVYGGVSMEKQVAELKFAQAVIGTPGRVLDHLRRRTLRLEGVQVLILDEADEMLSMGFADELEKIMAFVPDERQTLLFSATIPPDIKRYANRYMRNPEFLSLVEENVGADDVAHHYYMVSGVGRPRDLVRVIDFENPESAIIFANTRKDSEVVANYLKRQGYNAEYLNGDLPQKDRERIMRQMKDKELRFLVATDIAARGIDISELSHVINYLLPESPETYIHRTGRTGRAGRKGTAISLIGPREIGVYYYLKRIYNVALKERDVPTQAEIDLRREELRTESLVQEILDAVGPVADATLRDQTMRLLERDDAVVVVQALLQTFRTRGATPVATRASVGGVLSEIPAPDRIEPGALPQTLGGVADRVAIVASEFRGLPSDRPRRRNESSPRAAESAPAATAVREAEPVVAPPAPAASAPEPVIAAPAVAVSAPAVEADPARRAERGRRGRSRGEDRPTGTAGARAESAPAPVTAPERAAPVVERAAAPTPPTPPTPPAPPSPVVEAAPDAVAAPAANPRARLADRLRRRNAGEDAPVAAAPAPVPAAPAPAPAPAAPAQAALAPAAPAPPAAPQRNEAPRREAPAPRAPAPAPRAPAPPPPVAAEPPPRRRRRSSEGAEQAAEAAPANPVAARPAAPAPAAAAPVAAAPVAPAPAAPPARIAEAPRNHRRTPPPRAATPPPLLPGQARLFVNAGSRDGLDETVLTDTLADLGGLLPEDFAAVEVRPRFSFVTVNEDFAEDLITAVNGETVSGRTLRLEFARDDQ